jgi:hypothetical protein
MKAKFWEKYRLKNVWLFVHSMNIKYAPKGVRSQRLGRKKLGNGKLPKLRKRLQNAQSPTTLVPAYVAGDRVHTVLGALTERKTRHLKPNTTAKATKLLHTTRSLTTAKRT